MKVGSAFVEYGSPMVVYAGVELFGGHSNILFLTLSACNKVNKIT